MAFLGKKLAVAIPDTVLEERDSLREKTAKLGVIARACSIYGVDVIEVFRDEKKRGEPTLIRKVLEYIETPQYLRRKLYTMDESLKYAGILPPLRIPSHKPEVPVERLTIGEVREGVTNSDGTVDIGLERNPRLRERTGAGRRVTVRITSKNPLIAELASTEHVHEYWGYEVETRTKDEVLSDPRFALKIATSRYGNTLQSQVFRLRESVLKTPSLKLVFGSPSRGLFDIVGQQLSQRVDFVVNLFAEQHVETVRTEEAIFAALSLVNTLAL
ncbi:MAG TPA: putative RNA uridine N3 methyltransferase [Nitrososphaerales archaeon]|nr:putative RNA uridine N3 methyltransferase [Nitrososphaerales archaeon]